MSIFKSRRDDFSQTPHGLPEKLPADEKIIWQGRPDFVSLLNRVFLFKYILIYLLLLTIFSFILNQSSYGVTEAFVGLIENTLISIFCLGLFMFIGYLTCSTTIYTVTNKRIVMKIGIILDLSLNLPFLKIDSADLKLNSDGTGDIALTLNPSVKIAYPHLWPHCRAFHFSNPKPTLKCILDPKNTSLLIKDYWEKELKDHFKSTSEKLINVDLTGKELIS